MPKSKAGCGRIVNVCSEAGRLRQVSQTLQKRFVEPSPESYGEEIKVCIYFSR
jgi:hypothetical protein